MARDEVVFRVSADEAKALASFQKLIDKQNQVDNSTKRGTQSVRQQRGALDSWGASLKTGLGIGTGFAVMNRALSAGVDLLKEYDDYLGKIADKAGQAGGGAMRAFAIINPGEEGRQFMAEGYRTGAAAGLTIQETADMLQPLQAASATDEEGMARFEAAALAVQMGVDPQAAMSVERLGVSRGLAPGMATSQLVAASDPSGMGPADFARGAPRTTDFGDWQTGMAAIAALSVSTPEGQIPTAVGAAGRVFGRAADDTDFSERYGLAGMTEPEKIIDLWRQAAEDYDPAAGVSWDQHLRDFAMEFGKHLGSNEERLAAQQLVQQGQLFATAYDAAGGASADMLSDRVETMIAENPEIALAQTTRRAGATEDFYHIFGPEFERAKRTEESKIATGADWTARGAGAHIDEGLDPGVWARFASWIMEGGLSGSQSVMTAGTIQQGAERLEYQALERSAERAAAALDNLSEKAITRNAHQE